MVHDGDAHSVITTSIFSNTPTGATIAGTEGTITIPGIYYRPGKFTVASGDHKTTHTYEEPPANYAYLAYEAAETAWRIRRGGEVDSVPANGGLGQHHGIIDEVRRQIGIVFPAEQRAKEPKS
jgi:hypothetical protein